MYVSVTVYVILDIYSADDSWSQTKRVFKFLKAKNCEILTFNFWRSLRGKVDLGFEV